MTKKNIILCMLENNFNKEIKLLFSGFIIIKTI